LGKGFCQETLTKMSPIGCLPSQDMLTKQIFFETELKVETDCYYSTQQLLS